MGSKVENEIIEKTIAEIGNVLINIEHHLIMADSGQHNPPHTFKLIEKELRRIDAALRMLKGEGL